MKPLQTLVFTLSLLSLHPTILHAHDVLEWTSQMAALSAEMETNTESPQTEGIELELEFEIELEEEFSENPKSRVFDPLIGYNRFMTKVNDRFYFWVLKPAAKGYGKITPEGLRISISRFFENILFPGRFINNVLQLKFKKASIELTRFGINTTLGIVGLGDPAKQWFDLKAYPEDFGQTLGFYGMGSGIHLVLPILGPSNLRDIIGLGADSFTDPMCVIGTCYLDRWDIVMEIQTYKTLNHASLHMGEYESLKKGTIDFYSFLRDAYEQNRNKKIED